MTKEIVDVKKTLYNLIKQDNWSEINNNPLILLEEIKDDIFFHIVFHQRNKLLISKMSDFIIEKFKTNELPLEETLHKQNKNGISFLVLICQLHLDKFVDKLLEYHKKRDDDALSKILSKHTTLNRTMLHWAIEHRRILMIKKLIEKFGVNFHVKDENDWTPTFDAVYFDVLSIVNYLRKKGADIYCVDNKQKNLLHWGCYAGSYLSIKYLLKHGLKPTSLDKDNNTPLHDACKSGFIKANTHMKIFDILVEYGADINAINNHGETPYSILCKNADLFANNQESPVFNALSKKLIELGAQTTDDHFHPKT